MVRTLIQNDADPILKGYGKSPLEWAQEKDKQDIVAYLQTIVNTELLIQNKDGYFYDSMILWDL